MKMSESIDKLTTALVAFQSKVQPAKKDGANPFFKSNYATLQSLVETSKELLTKNNLAICQVLGNENGETVLTTTLMHTSGQYISGSQPVMPAKNDPQALGSAISYARRYGLGAILGVVTEDDDGEKAMGRGHKPPPAKIVKKEVNSVMDGKCPECGQGDLLPSKPEYGGGYYCSNYKSGCRYKDANKA